MLETISEADLELPYTLAQLKAIADPQARKAAENELGKWECLTMMHYGYAHIRDLWVAKMVLEVIDRTNAMIQSTSLIRNYYDRSRYVRPESPATRLISQVVFYTWEIKEIDPDITDPLTDNRYKYSTREWFKSQEEFDLALEKYAKSLEANFDQQWEVFELFHEALQAELAEMS